MKKFLVTTVLSLSMVLGFSAFALAEETALPSFPPDSQDIHNTLVAGDEANDNGFINANKTGVGVGGQNVNTNKFQTVEGQRTHGEYQNNTNSCASCHQTHTAAAENLLFKDGVYETCSACHDGTLGVFNVYAPSTAGTFGGTADGNASIHMVAGGMDVKAAPGGNRNADAADTANPWNAEFNCASCHSPHGSYSDRLLNYNPNQVGSTDMYFRAADGSYTDKDGNASATPVKTGGLKVVGGKVETTLPDAAAANAPEFVVYKTTSDSATLDKKVTQEPAGTPVIVLMKKNGTTGYVRDMNPWIGNVYNTRGGSGLEEMTNFYKAYTYGAQSNWKTNFVKFSATGTATDDGIVVKFGYGYVKNGPANGLNSVTNADISRATLVNFNFVKDLVKDPTGKTYLPKATFNGLDILEVDVNSYNSASGSMGVRISQFCAACHTDYFVSAGTDKDAAGNELGGRGVWSKAFRHNTTSDSYTCLKCHFAHGTDVSVMLDAKDQDVTDLVKNGMSETDAKAYMLDNNASSALKRYTNMSVCWKCHTSSHSEDMTNNQWVQGVNANVPSSNEYNKTGSNLPQGFVAPAQAGLPYVGNNNKNNYTNSGVVVKTSQELTTALANNTYDTIELEANIILTEPLKISRAITVDGNGYTLALNGTGTGSSSTLGLGVNSDATIKNLVITTTGKLDDNLVEVYGGNANFENVTIKGSTKAGLMIGNAGKVTVNGKITLTNNAWGGIEVKNSADTNITFAAGSSLSYTPASSKLTAPVVWVDADVFASNGSYVIDAADVLADPTLETSNGSQVWWQKK